MMLPKMEGMKMSNEEKSKALAKRCYAEVTGKKKKGLLLNEFCAAWGECRKSAGCFGKVRLGRIGGGGHVLRPRLLVGQGGLGATPPRSEIRWGACLAVSTGGCR